MKICLFTSSFLPKVAGMEIVIDRLAREFIALGHTVVVLAKTPKNMKTVPVFDYPVHYYPRSRSEVWFNGAPKHWLAKLHAEHGFDVIHAHQIYPTGYLGWQMQAQLGIPTVMTSHVGDVRDGSRFRKKWIVNRRMIRAMRQGSAVTGVGQGVCDTIDSLVGFRKAFYIGNGADIPADIAVPASLAAKLPFPLVSRGYDLSLCRLHPNKGLTHLIDALSLLKQRGRDFPPLLMAGSGREDALLRSKVQAAGLTDKVFLIGQVNAEERHALMHHARLFLQPSIVEGMPLTVLEALASACAVVGTDIPGIRELLEDGRNGRLVPPADAEALADALSDGSEHPERLDGFRQAALETARANTWRQVAQRYLRLFEQAIAAGGQAVLPS